MKTFKEYLETIFNIYKNASIHEDFANHDLGKLMRHKIPQFIMGLSIVDEERYYARGTIGAGVWTKTPWIAILDDKIGAKMQEGVYVVYLFSSDLQRVYLTLNQGVTSYKNTHGKRETIDFLESKAKEIRKYFDSNRATLDNNIVLNGTGTADLYEKGTIAYIEYQKNNLPNEDKLLEDLEYFINCYKSFADGQIIQDDNEETIEDRGDTVNSSKDVIDHIKSYISSRGFTYSDNEIENLFLSLKTKPFVILAGISGTGKTKLIELLAESIGANNKNGRFRLIPVKPNWSDSSDLLGYKNINGEFQPGPLTRAIIEAQREANRDKPYFVCLDEMNLARVEYYFSDFLSIMETRKKNSGGNIETHYIIDKDYLELEEDIDKYGYLTLPDNLYFIGTVNMDETTYPFSKKVLDRANTIEFSKIDLSLMSRSNDPIDPIEINNDFLRSNYISMDDTLGDNFTFTESTIEKLIEVNNILEKASLHIGYRVRDEVVMFMLYNHKFELLKKDDAFDMQLMQKILPRIQGSARNIYNVLVELFGICADFEISLDDIELVDKAVKYVEENIGLCKYKKSSIKIAHMLRRYEEDGFTSFWIQ